MANIIDYMRWRGDLPLATAPFNPVDNLILAELSYTDFGGAVGDLDEVPLREAVAALKAHRSGQDEELLTEMARSARFGGAMLTAYDYAFDPDEEKQFAAIAVRPGNGTTYCVFRGTDDTLVGWKEDFNLAFATPVPAQRDAADYLNRLARRYEGPLCAIGHSKGGNLAVYAGAFCQEPTRWRLTDVYNNDGPGQDPSTIASTGYQRVKNRLRTFIPQSSIVGMLLEHSDEYTIVKSDAMGIFQHDPYTWQVTATGFETARHTSAGSDYLNDTLRDWLAKLSSDERRAFADTLFQILSATNAQTITEITANWRASAAAMLGALSHIDKETAFMLIEFGAILLNTAVHNYVTDPLLERNKA